MTINFRGYIFDDTGRAVSGASVKLLDTGTDDTASGTTTDTSDSAGLWNFDAVAEGRYDVEITKGSSVRRILWNDQISLKEIDARNNTGNTTPAATFTNLTNNAANQVAVFSGANSTRADGDEIYLSFKLANSAGDIEEFARITAEAVDVTDGQEDGQLRFGVAKTNGTITDVFTINSTTGGETSMTFDVSGDLSLDADGGDIFFKDGGTTFGSATNTGGNLILKSGTTTALTFSGANLTAAGTIGSGAITSTGIVKTDDTTEATSTTDGSLQTDGGLSVAKDAVFGDDVKLLSDSAVIALGADGDTTLTHTDGTGLTLNSTNKLTFGDAATFVQQSSDGVMTIDGEATIDLNASTAVLVSNDLKLNSDSAVLGFGADNDTTLTHTDGTGLTLNSTNKLTFGDTGTFIHQSSDGVLTITSDTTVDINGAVAFDGAITGATNITLSGELDAATLDLSSSADIAGDLVLSGGADGALQFTNAGENSIKIPDNQASALIIEEGDNAYITFVTTNSSEAITVAKATTFSSTIAAATGSTIGNLTLANGSITDSGGALDFGNETLTTTGAVDFGAATVDSLSVSDANITNVGDIALDSISADGTDINIAVSDNSATALTIKQGSDAYLIVDTANSSESVSIGTGISGTAITLGHSTSETTVGDNLTITGTLLIPDGGTIGSASVTDAITITSAGRVGIDAASPATTLHVNHSGGAGVRISRDSQAGYLNLDTDGTNAHIANPGGSGTLIFKVNGDTQRAKIHPTGIFHIGEDATANGNMTTGLTIQQGAADNSIFALKSTDVDHGGVSFTTSGVETDTFSNMEKKGAEGGIDWDIINDNSGNGEALAIAGITMAANTDKDASARGAISFFHASHNSGGTLGDVGADANAFAVVARVGGSNLCRLLSDEDGDLYSTTSAQTFDAHDDIALVDALDSVRSDAYQVASEEWQSFLREKEKELIALKVLGAPVIGVPAEKQGMTNVTQLQRLHNGAIRQMNSYVQTLESRLAVTEEKLLALQGG